MLRNIGIRISRLVSEAETFEVRLKAVQAIKLLVETSKDHQRLSPCFWQEVEYSFFEKNARRGFVPGTQKPGGSEVLEDQRWA